MANVVSFADVEKTVALWARLVPDLTGVGNPLTNGLHLSVNDSPRSGAFGVVTRTGGTDDMAGVYDTPTVQVSVWGPNKEATERAARALAVAFRSCVAPVTTAAGIMMWAGEVTIVSSPDRGRPRYVVSARVAVAAV